MRTLQLLTTRVQDMSTIILNHIKEVSTLIDFFLAAILLTVLLAMTKKGWKGISNMLLIITGTTISGFLFSDAIHNFFPSVYSIGERFGNTVSSVGVFLFLTWLMEKDQYKEIFAKLLSSKIK